MPAIGKLGPVLRYDYHRSRSHRVTSRATWDGHHSMVAARPTAQHCPAAAHPLARGRAALRGAGAANRAGRRCPRRGGAGCLRGSSPRCAAYDRGGRRPGDPAAQLRAGWAGALLGPPERRAARSGRFRPDVPLGAGTAARGARDCVPARARAPAARDRAR
jgi:hypothetical protein